MEEEDEIMEYLKEKSKALNEIGMPNLKNEKDEYTKFIHYLGKKAAIIDEKLLEDCDNDPNLVSNILCVCIAIMIVGEEKKFRKNCFRNFVNQIENMIELLEGMEKNYYEKLYDSTS